MTLTTGSLFTGGGMLDAAVNAFFGAKTVWHCEHDPAPDATNAAARLLAYRYPDVPNLGDITKVDWSQVARPDIICGGSPCQDVSAAGRRAGMRPGTRSGLWASMCDAIDILRPSIVVWENVRGVTSAEAQSDLEPCTGCVGDRTGEPVLRALGRVLGDLADLGFDAEWAGLPASDIGAPHGRWREFVIAWPAANTEGITRGIVNRDGGSVTHTGSEYSKQRRQSAPGQTQSRWSFGELAGRGRASIADTSGDGWDEGRTEPTRFIGGPDAAVRGHALPDPNSEPVRVEPVTVTGSGSAPVVEWADALDWGDFGPAVKRWDALTRPVPYPKQRSRRGGGEQLSPRFSEWMMGWPAGWCDVPGLTRNEQIAIIGNGVCPQQAFEAFTRMAPALERAA